jgi:hypothetical protein
MYLGLVLVEPSLQTSLVKTLIAYLLLVITKKNTRVLKKSCRALLCLHLLSAALMSLATYFQETPLRPRLTTPKGFYALREDISF